MRNKLSNGPRRAQSNEPTDIGNRFRVFCDAGQASYAGDMVAYIYQCKLRDDCDFV